MKKNRKNSNPRQQPAGAQQPSMRTRKFAATVAALGVAVGINLQEVLAGPSSASKKPAPSASQPRTLTPSEIDKVKKLHKGSPSLPPGLQKRPDTLSIKMSDVLIEPNASKQPESNMNKLSPKGKSPIEKRPGSGQIKMEALE